MYSRIPSSKYERGYKIHVIVFLLFPISIGTLSSRIHIIILNLTYLYLVGILNYIYTLGTNSLTLSSTAIFILHTYIHIQSRYIISLDITTCTWIKLLQHFNTIILERATSMNLVCSQIFFVGSKSEQKPLL